MESDKIRILYEDDKLFQEYYNTTIGSFYTTYDDYLRERGLCNFSSTSDTIGTPIYIRYTNEYTIIDRKQFLLTKIKYGI